MRVEFVEHLTELAREDPSIMLIVGDLGYGVVEEFRDAHPRRFLNAGVAEQNMLGVAAGLALSGYRPFVYSIANFPTFRCLEQIRNDVCQHNLSVTIVSVGAGLSYGALGYSHHGLEDVAIMRALPEMRVYGPADAAEATACTMDALHSGGPAYIRLGKGGEPLLHEGIPPAIATPIRLLPGSDVSVVVSGPILERCLRAARDLSGIGIGVEVLSCPVVVPFDVGWLRTRDHSQPIVVVEEHQASGGLGSEILEQVNSLQLATPVFRVGADRAVRHLVGAPDHLRDSAGLSVETIAQTCIRAMR